MLIVTYLFTLQFVCENAHSDEYKYTHTNKLKWNWLICRGQSERASVLSSDTLAAHHSDWRITNVVDVACDPMLLFTGLSFTDVQELKCKLHIKWFNTVKYQETIKWEQKKEKIMSKICTQNSNIKLWTEVNWMDACWFSLWIKWIFFFATNFITNVVHFFPNSIQSNVIKWYSLWRT